MLRIWVALLVLLSLAACSSAPPKAVRSSGTSAYGENALRTLPPGSPRFVDHSVGREEISIQAMSLVGIPYRWGGNTPDSGFDCSGLVRYVVARAADVDLPRTTADISRRGESIEPDEIAPGDLIFFNTTGRPHSHVGIYAGKLRFVNAPSTGGTVRLDYLTNPYWAKRFDGIRRVAPPVAPRSPFDAPTELAAPRRGPAQPQPQPQPAVETEAATAPAMAPRTVPIPVPVPSPVPIPASASPAGPAAATASTSSSAATADAPKDAIDAAADAFEPPPPAAMQAARQARGAGAMSVQPGTIESGVQIMRASSPPAGQNAPTSTTDDPIARFAHSGE